MYKTFDNKTYEYFKKDCFNLKDKEACYMAGDIYISAENKVKATKFIEKSCEFEYSLCLYEKWHDKQVVKSWQIYLPRQNLPNIASSTSSLS
jgi:hypothetical protein